MSQISLPAVIHARLDAAASGIRRLQLFRGICWLILLLVAVGSVVLFFDFLFGMPFHLIRICSFGVMAVALVGALMAMVLPWLRPVDPRALAALIEHKHPELGERLVSTVQLLGDAEDSACGAPAFITHLQSETAARLEGVDVARCLPRVSRLLAGAVAAALACAMVPALLFPSYAERGRRFLTSWYADQPRWDIVVSPGNAAVAKGRQVAVTARFQRTDARESLPRQCYLSHQVGRGPAQRTKMSGDDGLFSFTLDPVAGDTKYRLESGDFTSEDFELTAVDPVELAEVPVIAVAAPAYVNRNAHPPQEFRGTHEISVLEFSTVTCRFLFNRSPVAGHVEVRAVKKQAPDSRPTMIPIAVEKGRVESSISLPALTPGEYSLRLFLETDHGMETTQPLPSLIVWRDDPPEFADFRTPAGKQSPGAADVRPEYVGVWVPPDDLLPLRFAVEDKVGLDRVEMEYRINGGPVFRQVIAQLKGKQSAALEYKFDLRGKVKEGDWLAYRLSASDNRRLSRGTCRTAAGAPAPESDLLPQVAYEPAPVSGSERWYVVAIAGNAKPVAEQEILARHRRFVDKLRAIQKKLMEERGQLQRARDVNNRQGDVNKELDGAERKNRALQEDLRGLGLAAFSEEDLHPLTALALDVAETELARTGQALATARNHALVAGERDKQLRLGDAELSRAHDRLDDMARKLDRLAKQRIDESRLTNLAQRQEELGKQAGDATTADALKAAAADEEAIAEALRRLLRESTALQEALKAAAGPGGTLAQMAEKQQALADKLKELVAKEPQALNETKLADDHMRQVAELFKQQKLAPIPEHMKQAQLALERMARLTQKSEKSPLQNMADKARMLAREQSELRESLKKMAGAAASMSKAKEPVPELTGKALQQAQENVQAALKELSQARSAPARAAMAKAAQALQRAANQVSRQAADARSAMLPGKNDQPARNPRPGEKGSADPELLVKELRPFLGRPWGELPGQLRTRILQDMRARFGDDYSLIIQGYFEKLGER